MTEPQYSPGDEASDAEGVYFWALKPGGPTYCAARKKNGPAPWIHQP